MTYYNDGQQRLLNSDVEQDERFDELRLRGLYEPPHLESDCLGARLENAGELMMAARSEPEYDECGSNDESTAGSYRSGSFRSRGGNTSGRWGAAKSSESVRAGTSMGMTVRLGSPQDT
jgi:hypothetical protein